MTLCGVNTQKALCQLHHLAQNEKQGHGEHEFGLQLRLSAFVNCVIQVLVSQFSQIHEVQEQSAYIDFPANK